MLDTYPNIELLLEIVVRIALAVAIGFAARWLAPLIRTRLHRLLLRTPLTPALITLTLTMVYIGVWIVAVMAILAVLGFPVTAIVAAAGIVIVLLGVALQQSLRDLAATVSFLLFVPFKLGDTIETNGVTGTVLEIQPLSTVILRGDNKTVILPNAQIQQQGITNYTKAGTLRIDMVFGIGYQDDVAKARQIVRDVLASEPRVLPSPPPAIVVLGLSDSSVQLGVRPFVNHLDYWQVEFELTERIKRAFDEAGISIPFPQRDVHVFASPREPAGELTA